MSDETPAPSGAGAPQPPTRTEETPEPSAPKKPFSITDVIISLSKYIPSVQKPLYKQSFNTRIMWVGIALISYLILANITVIGIGEVSFQNRFFEIVLGARFGSIMTLGIGPIVTAGIILQLMVGSKIINWDMTKPESRKKFQSTSKVLAVAFAVIESIAFVMFGALGVIPGGPGMMAFVIAQLAMGGLIVIILDDLVQKWGFGSGISLFIVAGVGSQIILSIFSPLTVGCVAFDFANCFPNEFNAPVGLLWQTLASMFAGASLTTILITLVPIISTVGVFLLAVYVQAIRVEIPLAFSALRGFGRNWSLKLFYTSNIPVILTTALLANLQLMTTIGVAADPATGLSCGLFGCIDPSTGSPVSGLVYYLSSPGSSSVHGGVLTDIISGVFVNTELLRMVTYTLFLAAGSTIFSIFWMTTAGMDAKSVARQIEGVGMQIPGYRRDPRIIESVLNRYIPHLAFLGGLFVGLLAAFADIIGAVGTGVGILLTVMILYNYYEELRNQDLEGAHPIFRKVLGG